MKSKLFALLLCVMMLVPLVMITISADGEPTYATQIGNKKFETLDAAIQEANSAGQATTIELLADVEFAEKYTISGNVTIAGKHTIKRAGSYKGTLFEVKEGATLTLDGGLGSTVRITGRLTRRLMMTLCITKR